MAWFCSAVDTRVFFTNSGSEATETQVKLAWYYNNMRGKPHKKAIISRWNSFHGSTIMAGSLKARISLRVERAGQMRAAGDASEDRGCGDATADGI